MDFHPAGLPRLVGPDGAPYPNTDYSHSFRYLPNNITDVLPPSNLESLPIPRRHPHPLKVRASPSSPRGAASSHPLRLCTEHPKPGSPREYLPSSPSHHLLASGPTTFPVLLDVNPHQPLRVAKAPSSITNEAAETVASQQISEPTLVTEKNFTSISED